MQLGHDDPALPALLVPGDPPPFRVVEGDSTSPYLITCDHAGRAIPAALGNLGLEPSELMRHIAWDIGAADVAEGLARELGGFAILQTYSRLVIDCNRPLDVESSIAKLSESTPIPGNEWVSVQAARLRAEAVFWPYHRRLEQELERRHLAAIPTVYVAVHSFTPRYRGLDRPWHAGVLHGRDARFAGSVLELLRQELGLVIGDNEPYFVSELSDYGVHQHAERRGLLYVELEVRQDQLATRVGQHEWTQRLARVITATTRRMVEASQLSVP